MINIEIHDASDLSWAKDVAVCLPPSSGNIANSKALHKATHSQFMPAMSFLHSSFCIFPLSQTKSDGFPQSCSDYSHDTQNLGFSDDSSHSLLNL